MFLRYSFIVFFLVLISCAPRVGKRTVQKKGTTIYYFNKLKQHEGNTDSAGRKTGHWKFYHPSGLLIEGDFLNGEKDGAWITTDNGIPVSEFHYRKNEKHGKQLIYHKGKLMADQYMEYGMRSGVHSFYLANGDLYSVINYTYGNYDGSYLTYHSNNIVSVEAVFANNALMNIKQYNDSTGKSIDYGTLENGNGKLKLKYEDNESFIYREISMEHGIPNGVYQQFDENGKMTDSGNVINGYKAGIWKSYVFNKKDYKAVSFDTCNKDIDFYLPDPNRYPPLELYTLTEKMPEYPGGERAMMEFVYKNVKYPREAREKGIQGKVSLTFVINELGEISNIKVISKTDALLNAEAIRVVSGMPRWQPGFDLGAPVKVISGIPVKFSLE